MIRERTVGWLTVACVGVSALTTSVGVVSPTNSPIVLAAPGVTEGLIDYNGDGFGDLAIGVPAKDYSIDVNGDNVTETDELQDGGAIQVAYGSAGGPNADPNGIDVPGVADVQFINQQDLSAADTVEPGDRYGYVHASGDFNGDGYSDLAVGIPDEDLVSQGVNLVDAGAVHVIYGSNVGLNMSTTRDDQFFHRGPSLSADSLSVTNTSIDSYDRFGEALTVGDFNDDGRDDLAIGVPYQELEGGTLDNVGGVDIVYGSSTGLGGGFNEQAWHSGDIAAGSLQLAGRMGSTLQAGDFDGDGRDDLAIGYKQMAGAGIVRVIFGTDTVLSTTGRAPQTIQQGVNGVPGAHLSGDGFSAAMTVGDFNNDGRDDLAIGAPGDKVGAANRAGTVTVVSGSSQGLLSVGAAVVVATREWTQTGLSGDGSETDDRFGFALAGGDFNADGYDDIGIGVPFETVGGDSGGAVNVIYGSSAGLHENTEVANQFWSQDSPGVRGGTEPGDRFGMALSANDYNGAVGFDLAIGAPHESIGIVDTGAVSLLFGNSVANGLDATGDFQMWPGSGDPGELLGTPSYFDVLGSALDGGQAIPTLWSIFHSGTPGAVRNLEASSGDDIISLHWSSPIDEGGRTLEYEVVWTPRDAGAGPSGSAVVAHPGVDIAVSNGVFYNISVAARLANNGSSSAAVEIEAVASGSIRPITPARYLETRGGANTTFDGQFEGIGRVAAGSVTTVRIVGRGAISGAVEALVVNLTVVNPDTAGFATIYPCGDEVPDASNVNYLAGQTVPNAAFVAPDDNGDVCIYTLSSADLLLDVSGYVTTGSTPNAFTPLRLTDTRQAAGLNTYDGQGLGAGRRPAGSITEIQIGDRICPCDFESVMLNVTAVRPVVPGFLTVFDCAADVPNASHVNFAGGDIVPNAVLAPVSSDGRVCVYTSAETDLLVDISGSSLLGFPPTPIVPARFLETRPSNVTIDGQSQQEGRRPAGSTYRLKVTSRGEVPKSVTAIVMNVTAVNPSAAGFITVFSCDDSRPVTSNINFVAGGVYPNAVLTGVGRSGEICIFTTAETHLLVDISGHITA